MAHTIKYPNGQPSTTVTISGKETLRASGPPSRGASFTRGIYIREVAGSSGTWRWVEDQNTPGVASPTSFTFEE